MSRDRDDLNGSHRGSYDEYDHSDEELYVYDQRCENCRYYDSDDFCCKRTEEFEMKEKADWCYHWKGKGGGR